MNSQIIPSCVKQKQKNPCSSSKTPDCKRYPATSSCPCEDSAVGSHLLPPLEPPEPVKGLGLCAGNSRQEFILHSSPGLAAWSSAQGSCSQWCVHVLPCPRPQALSQLWGMLPVQGGVSWDVVSALPRATPQTAPAAAAALLSCAWQFLFPALHPQQHQWGWLKEWKMLI